MNGSRAPQAPEAAPCGLASDKKLAQRLAGIAFVGAFLGQAQAAEAIFRSLRVLQPGNPNVDLGLAMVHTLAGSPQEGLAVVERAAALGADAGLATVCAGIMLREAGHRAAADRTLALALAQGNQGPGTGASEAIAQDVLRELTTVMRG